MIFKDYYKILNLDTNKVTTAEIKVKYKELVKKFHPDVNIGNKLAEEKFKDITESYKVLTDASAKRKYDRMWVPNVGNKKIKFEESDRQKDNLFSDFFNMFFGQTTNKKIKNISVNGENIETSIDISIKEGFFGVSKQIVLKSVLDEEKTFTVKIPEGIKNKEKIKLSNEGKAGINGGKNGDLIIQINIKDDNKFSLEKNNLLTNIYLTPWEAVLGTKIEINGLEEKITIFIPEGIQSGEILTIPNKGYKCGELKGNLIAKIQIMVPKNLNEKEKELFVNMKKKIDFNPRINKK